MFVETFPFNPRDCLSKGLLLTRLRSDSCITCNSQESGDSRSSSYSLATEEYSFQLNSFIERRPEDDPLSIRPANYTRLRPSSSSQHAFDMWLDHIFPYSNYPRRHATTLWEDGHDVVGSFGRRPWTLLTRTYTEHTQSKLMGIGSQFDEH